MIFIIPCKYNPHCKIIETVESIAKYHPDADIIVVDSDSDDKSYFDNLHPNAMVLDEANKYYEPGALWRVTSRFYDTHYILVQDSMVFKKSITDIVESTDKMKCFINFYERTDRNHMGVPRDKFMEAIHRQMGTTPELGLGDEDYGFVGVFGSSFIISRDFLVKISNSGLFENLAPTNKFEHQIAERVFGIAALDNGVDLTKHTIIGNLHELMAGPGFDRITETLHTDIFDKTWNNKHRQ